MLVHSHLPSDDQVHQTGVPEKYLFEVFSRGEHASGCQHRGVADSFGCRLHVCRAGPVAKPCRRRHGEHCASNDDGSKVRCSYMMFALFCVPPASKDAVSIGARSYAMLRLCTLQMYCRLSVLCFGSTWLECGHVHSIFQNNKIESVETPHVRAQSSKLTSPTRLRS